MLGSFYRPGPEDDAVMPVIAAANAQGGRLIQEY